MRDNTVIGPGGSAAIPSLIRSFAKNESGVLRTAVVVGGGFDIRPWSEAIRAAMTGLSPIWLIQNGMVEPHGVAVLARRIRECAPDAVVAVGGGTVLDAAKAAVHLSGVTGVDAAVVVAACTSGFCPPSVHVPLVAVPTTPGTGAEVTPFATIWEPTRNRKLSLSGRAPAGVILDPDLLRSLDGSQLAAGVLDTLCQGAEAAWSGRSTPESESHGLAAVRLAGSAIDSLDARRPGDSARLMLQIAGNLSGFAIASATTSSCHALSYPLTLRAGLAHGHACGVTFGRMLQYNADVTEDDCSDPRGAGRVRDVIARIVGALGAADPGEAGRKVDDFLRRNGLATLEEVPCSPDLLAREALAYPRMADNPRMLTFDSLVGQLSAQEAGGMRCA